MLTFLNIYAVMLSRFMYRLLPQWLARFMHHSFHPGLFPMIHFSRQHPLLLALTRLYRPSIRNSLNLFYAALLPVILLKLTTIQGCSKEQLHPKDTPIIAAEWDGNKVTREHFQREYTYFSTYTNIHDRPGTRNDYARLILERMIIAEKGRNNGLDTRPQVRDEVKRRREMAMRRFLLEHKVKPNIMKPEENEIRKAFDRAHTRLNLQQIFAPDERTAHQYYNRLQQGEPFDMLAIESMRKAGLPPEHQDGMMGWVTFDDLDEAPEETVFQLDRGSFSKPVESLRGWHIFKLHDRERTIHLDDMSYVNMRDGLKHTLYQRRFDEASARYIRDLVYRHELALDRMAVMALYEKITPTLPRDGSPIEMTRYIRDLNLVMPELDESTPIAFVDREPYTAGQFLRQMPDIPVHWIKNDFRHAIEIAIRDSILASKAMEIRADTARNVQFETRFAEYSGLYYATIGAVLDTLNLDQLPEEYYDVWKDEQFIDYQVTDFYQYEFIDSLSAADAILRFKANGDWAEVLRNTPDNLYSVRQLSKTTREEYNLPVHRLPVSGRHPDSDGLVSGHGSAARDIIEGPFDRGTWVVLQAKSRITYYKPFDEVENKISQLLRDRSMQVAHREALPSWYNREDAIVYQDVLDDALPYYYTGF